MDFIYGDLTGEIGASGDIGAIGSEHKEHESHESYESQELHESDREIIDIHPEISDAAGASGGSSDISPIVVLEDEDEKDTTPTSLGVSGLFNMGNTCFMNSAIQAIAKIDTFVAYLIYDKSHVWSDVKKVIRTQNEGITEREVESRLKETIVYNFSRLIKCLWSSNKVVRPRTFKSVVDKLMSIFEGFQQHDSQEFLSILMNRIDDETNVKKEFDFITTNTPIRIDIERLNMSFSKKDDERDRILSNIKKITKIINEFMKENSDYESKDEYKSMIKTKTDEQDKLNIVDEELCVIATDLNNIYESTPEDYMYIQSMLEWKNILRGRISIINEIFSGICVNTFTCSECGKKKFKFDRYDTLTLHLPDLDTEYTRKDYKITDLLRNYTNQSCEDQKINKHCYYCKKTCPFTMQINLFTIPQKMIIMIKKYRQIEEHFFRSDEKIIYDHKLDLTDYMHEYCDKANTMMILISGIRHQGAMGGGHYFSYAKNFMNEKWYRYDDESVFECSDKEVIESNSYVLFYSQ